MDSSDDSHWYELVTSKKGRREVRTAVARGRAVKDARLAAAAVEHARSVEQRPWQSTIPLAAISSLSAAGVLGVLAATLGLPGAAWSVVPGTAVAQIILGGGVMKARAARARKVNEEMVGSEG